jgi:hypothetical protein
VEKRQKMAANGGGWRRLKKHQRRASKQAKNGAIVSRQQNVASRQRGYRLGATTWRITCLGEGRQRGVRGAWRRGSIGIGMA